MKIVIFCGGFGTRMWPVSRKGYPKQFYPLLGGKSFFRHTLSRFEKAFDPSDIIVSTEERYTNFIYEQAPELPRENVIGEPERRDNLAAIGLSAAILHKRFPNEVIFFSWSDHLIKDEDKFLEYVKKAAEIADKTGHPVSIDEKPRYASVNLGWLELGNKVEGQGDVTVFEIERHVEKPKLEVAEELLKSDKYLWHTGYGAWRSDVLMGYYEKYAPETFAHLTKMSDAWGTDMYPQVLKEEYGQIEKTSIDLGLFEKIPAHERYTIPVDVGWEDAGTWQLMYESLVSNKEENLIEGEVDVDFIESKGNLIVGPKGKEIAVIGLSNIVVVDTKDGLLVSTLVGSKDVKQIFGILEKDKPQYVD